MPRHPAAAIANEFLRRRGSSSLPSQMFIQKLAYIAHGWNLAINKEPLIEENPEAWDNGPVYRSIWDHIKDNGYQGQNCALVDRFDGKELVAELTPREKLIIDHVWKKYNSYSANKLSQMTHEPDTPWSKAYFDRGRNAQLSNDEIQKHYIELAMAGRGKR